MNEERSIHPLDYVSVLRRRKWWLITPVVVCIFVGALLALFLPREYLSQATIAVAAPTLSPELLRGVSSMDKEERQRAISQQLLSSTVLQRVVREEKIDPERPVDETAAWLRANVAQNVSVPQPIGANKSDPSKVLDSFILGYTDSDPQRAQRIANRLAYVFAEENSKRQLERSENTAEVLSQQLQNSQARLTRLENDLAEKKKAYMGRLPDQVNANVQSVNGLRSQLESISTQLRGEQDCLSMSESQIQQMRQGTGTEAMTASGVATVNSQLKRLNDLQQQLAAARGAGFTDKHPEIITLQEEIKQARADLANAQKTERAGGPETLQADPLYRQKLQERDSANFSIRELRRKSQEVQSQIAMYQARVDAAPMVEQELASLTREYEFEKAHLADLTTKHQQATIAEDLTRKQGGERFSVLYPATLPTSPQKPDRLRIMLLAVAAGLVLGAGAAVGREFLDRSVYDAQALQSEFDLPVLGEIPRIPA
jgi:polysaccharide chain length determinant protein (PEP-CTERM system associated)